MTKRKATLQLRHISSCNQTSDFRLLDSTSCKRLWNKLIPSKVSIFGCETSATKTANQGSITAPKNNRTIAVLMSTLCSGTRIDWSSLCYLLPFKAYLATTVQMVGHPYCPPTLDSRNKPKFHIWDKRHNPQRLMVLPFLDHNMDHMVFQKCNMLQWSILGHKRGV